QIFEKEDMFKFFHYYFSDVYSASLLTKTDRRPTIRERVRSAMYSGFKYYTHVRDDIRIHNQYHWVPSESTTLVANLYGAIDDVLFWLKHGVEIHNGVIHF
ncbi:MAG: hypothetical protein Q7R78_00060, partial [bacterium]|nr:hypothetical protein [bacterium]